ncbi:hypothetical protein RND71_010488 [Anisodus tanguticus]|uniref:Uncharacterized protein n=1 Tax=Anisodus tanguticus TaxID=243964 RepID=A0AAE1SKE6_9SOLA|nr:hypothetical protein RND71_010488 [Anisodus tanguticus]
MPTSGYNTQQDFSQSPPRFQWAASSGTPTATPSSTVPHFSSSFTPQFRLSDICIRDSSFEPDTSTAYHLARHSQDAPQPCSRDSLNILIVEPEEIGDAYPIWGQIPPDLKRQILLEFRKLDLGRPLSQDEEFKDP